jgi:hypothetical protein
MPRDLSVRIVDALLERIMLMPDIYESLMLLSDETRQAFRDQLAEIVQREIARDALEALDAAAAKQRGR